MTRMIRITSNQVRLRALLAMVPLFLCLFLGATPNCRAVGTQQGSTDSLFDPTETLTAPGALRADPGIALLDLARARFEGGDWQEALQPARALLAMDKEHPEAHGIVGSLLALTGQKERAEQELAFFEGKGIQGFFPELIRAVLLAQKGDYGEAEKHLDLAAGERPNHPVVLYYRGSLHLVQNRLEEAERSLKAVISQKPYFAPALAGLGQISLRKGNRDEAARYYDQALRIMPDVILYRRQLIDIYKAAGREEEAAKATKELLYYTPGVKQRYLAGGMRLLSTGQYEAAIREMDRVIGIYKKAPEAYYIRAAARINLKKNEQALEDVRTFIGQQWGSPQAHHYAGMCYLALGDRDLAEQHFRTVIAVNPNMGRSFVPMTIIEQLRGNYERALQGLALARQGGEPRPLIDFFAAHVILAKGDEEGFKGAMKGASGLMPGLSKDAVSHFPNQAKPGEFAEDRNLMVLYFVNGWHGLSLDRGKALLKRDKDDRFALYYQALSHVARRDFERAALSFQELLKLEPELTAAHMGLGQAYLSAGQAQKAIRAFQKTVETDPNYGPAYLGLGDASVQAGKNEQAVKAYETAAGIEPERVAPHLKLARLLAQRKDRLDEALTHAEKASGLSPKDPYVLEALGWVQVQRGETREGLKNLSEAAKRLGQDPVVLYHLGVAYYRADDMKKAEGALRKALSLSKDFPGSDHAGEILKKISE